MNEMPLWLQERVRANEVLAYQVRGRWAVVLMTYTRQASRTKRERHYEVAKFSGRPDQPYAVSSLKYRHAGRGDASLKFHELAKKL